MLIVEFAAAIVFVLLALAYWRAALAPVALVVASAAAILLALAPLSEGRIIWADVIALAFIGATVATALLLQKRRYSPPQWQSHFSLWRRGKRQLMLRDEARGSR